MKDCYDHPRLTHREYIRSILHAPPLKANNGRGLRKLYDIWWQHIRAIELSHQLDLDKFFTIVMELKMDEVTR